MSLPTTIVDPNDVVGIVSKLLAMAVAQVDGVMGANYASSHPDFLAVVFNSCQSAYFQQVNLAQRQAEDLRRNP